MNYFGLFFTFGIIGVIVGCMITAAVYRAVELREQRRVRTRDELRKKLYIHTLSR